MIGDDNRNDWDGVACDAIRGAIEDAWDDELDARIEHYECAVCALEAVLEWHNGKKSARLPVYILDIVESALEHKI